MFIRWRGSFPIEGLSKWNPSGEVEVEGEVDILVAPMKTTFSHHQGHLLVAVVEVEHEAVVVE